MSSMKPTLPGTHAAFDPNAAREKLAATRGPVYWRSLEELADSEGFRRWLRQQNPRLGEALLMDRRGFLKLLGASLALAGLAACSHPPQTGIVPYVHKPIGQVDGLPRYFATVLTREGYAQGVLVADHQGRPTKAEGNPGHPASLGGTDIFAQAAILQLWDPDRSQSIRHRGVTSTWDEFVAAALATSARFDRSGGDGLHVLTGPVTSPTLAAQLDTLARRYPKSRWHVHRPGGGRNTHDGAQLAFGRPLSTRLHLDRARVIVALDADPLSDPAAGTRYGRDYATTRQPDQNHGAMSRLYAIEPTPSLTGLMADHRLPLAFPEVGGFALQLARKIGVAVPAGAAPATGEQARWLEALGADLQAHRGASLILVGALQPAWLHALGHAMNAALGNVGKTIDFSAPVEALPAEDDGLVGLVSAMHAGRVDTLLALEVNPVYAAPADLDFTTALKRVPHLLHLGLYLDETGEVAEWHVPLAHPLEAWSDARAFDGTASIAQPLIAPLYDGKSVHEVLAAFTGDNLFEGHALVRRQWQSKLPDDKSWNAALQAGVVPNTALPAVATSRPRLAPQGGKAVIPAKAGLRRQDAGANIGEADGPKGAPQERRVTHFDLGNSNMDPGFRQGDEQKAGHSRSQVRSGKNETSTRRMAGVGGSTQRLELLLRPDPTIGDGHWANNGWLQELPKPLTQLTWDNAALISPALAAGRKLKNGDMVELRAGGRKLEVPVWIVPGQAARTITLHLGYGRRSAGHVGNGLGFDAYALQTSESPGWIGDVAIAATGRHYPFAGTQHHFNMEGRDLVREGTLAEYLQDPHFATAHDRYPSDPPSLYPDYPPGEYAWGMTIDLNACIGCKACTIACQAENNIPVVGKDQVRMGREMHWIRVDHYHVGGADNPRTVSQPVPCMMCEHAPCEVVCPVGATVHDSEGLNLQVYNRCVGTRFCSNNCPYKVRRFNFLQYADKTTPQLKAMRNPEVSVRRRGVMEKCTYCIQRIETAHIQADKESRRIRDGEILTACQAVCPTQAIRFGDISDKQSNVAKAKASPRNYAMLNELGTRPRTTYLARLRNPNPALEDEPA
jgi:molybdopterin-containing oxidoreductase family iron-sulfur binding subunit